ncbi:sigma-54-dependent Fis family transcriptional regulator [Vibrio tapetis]|uniref:Sigma-54 dependent transcriptional regulator n=1 Tax=Vibrio tapetis subsp. tapetis TaxID=1671868 RepID=A0A2N8ZL28_9VIBR|nr:sigma-54-dependent Fis family transcriptional regulator [Vibrio tapetis]SON52592.1 Sigma-54 dependent transcriptional regulator [Vibrio tapetis subsp. tapetis]
MQLRNVQSNNWLTTSWDRSSEAGLKRRCLPEDIRLSSSLLKQRCYQSTNLIKAVEHLALPLFNQMFARTDSRLILTDIEGVILASWGQETFREKLTAIALSTGSCWQEQLKGTNAIGTAIVEAKPVSILGEQHFIHQHRFISCSASPIFDHQGHMLGVLDVTSEQLEHELSVQVLVQNMVQLIENQLLNYIPNGSIRVDLACEKSLLNSGWQGTLIADESGQILAQNRVACQLLEQSSVLGVSIDELFKNRRVDTPFVFEKKVLGATHVTKKRTLQTSCDLHFGDAQIEQSWQQANRVIDKGVSLLILGETGVGKGEFVKALHKQSLRKSSPLVAVNCGSLPKDLIETELFGYAPGAFTGANAKGYQGKIRQADKGILFLDEIADMPLDAQCRLLHVLQDKVVAPVGSNQTFTVDCQIIAATHKNLPELVKQGAFREDLYYRLNGLIFTLPSLNQRQDKRALIEAIHKKHQQQQQRISPSLMKKLEQYSWPGNVRELDNVIKVASLLSSDESVLMFEHIPTHLAEDILGEPGLNPAKEPSTGAAHTDEVNLKTTVEENVLQTYLANKRNISKTSRILGISRNTLYRKLRSIGGILSE